MALDFHSPLALIDSTRPVFLVIMAISLILFVWRLARHCEGWSGWLLMSGAILLGFGYGVVLPMIEAEAFNAFTQHHHVISTAMATLQVIKQVTMNLGWLMLGMGFAFHTKVFAAASAPEQVNHRQAHESLA